MIQTRTWSAIEAVASTAISLARGYVVRRLFNRLDRRRWERAKSRQARDVSGELLPGRRATNDNTRAQGTRKGAA